MSNKNINEGLSYSAVELQFCDFGKFSCEFKISWLRYRQARYVGVKHK